MEAWDGYWRKTPHIKRIVYRSLPEETTRAAALKKGEVDIHRVPAHPTHCGRHQERRRARA